MGSNLSFNNKRNSDFELKSNSFLLCCDITMRNLHQNSSEKASEWGKTLLKLTLHISGSRQGLPAVNSPCWCYILLLGGLWGSLWISTSQGRAGYPPLKGRKGWETLPGSGPKHKCLLNLCKQSHSKLLCSFIVFPAMCFAGNRETTSEVIPWNLFLL